MKRKLPKPYYSKNGATLYKGDSLKLLKKIEDESIDLIFADPPYFLSNDGITCKSGKMASVNKGSWDKSNGLTDKYNFNRAWIKECYRILSPDGSIWVSGTLHNIYSVGMALEENNFKILNNITWQKTNPPPNLACRCFTHSEYSGLRVPPIRNGIPTKRRMIPTSFLHAIRRNVLSVRK